MSLPEPYAAEREQAAEDEEHLASILGGPIKDDTIKNEEEDEIFTLFLWETFKDVFEIFKIARMYLSENYALPENIVLRLVEGRKLPLEESLFNLAIIHNSYVSVLIKGLKR